MLTHTISISCSLEVAVVALFLYYQGKKKARSRLKTRQKTEKALLSYLLVIYSSYFKILRPHDVRLTRNLRMEKS